MKTMIFLDNSSISSVDLSDHQKGNPGIGGTQYMMWQLSCYLNNSTTIETIVASPYPDRLPSNINTIKCDTVRDSINYARSVGIDILIIRGPLTEKNIFTHINNCDGLKIIIWSHNFEDFNSLNQMDFSKNIKANVCVGKQQYKRLGLHPIRKKSTFIFNGIEEEYFKHSRIRMGTGNTIKLAYIGTLDERRGFNDVIEIFKRLNKRESKYQLHLIGGNNLYRDDIEEEIPHSISKEGILLPGIIFHGKLNREEKISVLKSIDIGLAPSKRETFGISTVEMQSLGIPIVGFSSYGNKDTVDNKRTGMLSYTKIGVLLSIKYMVKKNSVYSYYSKNSITYSKSRFNMQSFFFNWESLITDIYYNRFKSKETLLIPYNKYLSTPFLEMAMKKIMKKLIIK
ncbi:glycosyltransferase [Vagococcus lutrae]|uniref:glycosyltransferase family 4 protein n=1 Tax=Vagococcus lutrae TaxID=81947 RepID=UPI00232FD0C0|nr:glycosyltransferase [Vagococcus lutrae]WCG04784.1 glycosyltransferase [Vagococcus lutrae]